MGVVRSHVVRAQVHNSIVRSEQAAANILREHEKPMSVRVEVPSTRQTGDSRADDGSARRGQILCVTHDGSSLPATAARRMGGSTGALRRPRVATTSLRTASAMTIVIAATNLCSKGGSASAEPAENVKARKMSS